MAQIVFRAGKYKTELGWPVRKYVDGVYQSSSYYKKRSEARKVASKLNEDYRKLTNPR